MDLRTIKEILERAPVASSRPQLAGTTVRNLIAFRAMVDAVDEIEPLQPEIEKIRRSPVYSTIQDELDFSSSVDSGKLYRQGDDFFQMVQALDRIVDAIVRDLPPESITVKLPEVTELAAVVAALGDLQTALSQLVMNEETGGDVKVEGWEKGSLLIFLYLKTLAAIDLVGRALKSAALIYQEMQKGRLMGQQVRHYKIKNETLEDLQNAQATLLKELTEREARAIDTASFKKKDAERLERIKNSLRLLAELMERGTVIYPSLNMPSEQRGLFPDFKQLGNVVTSIKQLEDVGDPNGAATKGERPETDSSAH